jgi:hypothetical protein
MAENTITLVVPFESLITSIKALKLKEKRKLWELLDAELAEYEDEIWEKDTASQLQIQEARAAYKTGDYLTLDEYLANPPQG